MGRIRTIKPEFPQSESIGQLSRNARLLFIQLWTIVDDAGRTRAPSRMLASLLYPYDEDAVDLLGDWLAELSNKGMVNLYKAEGHSYLQIVNWLKHQKIDHPSPSRLPPFLESSRILANDTRSLAPDHGPVPRTTDHGPRTGKDSSPNKAQIESLYGLYPKKIGKAAALKSITRALKLRPFEELLSAVQNFTRKIAREGTDPQFIPHPATWFNQGRYDDEEFKPDYVVKKNGGQLGKGESTLEALRQCLAENSDGSGPDGDISGWEDGPGPAFALLPATNSGKH